MVNIDYLKYRLNGTKSLIERDNLNIPSDLEEQIVSVVAEQILTEEWTYPKVKTSELDTELDKLLKSLDKHFPKSEYSKRFKKRVVDRHIIHKCLNPQEYITSFRGPQLVWELQVPYSFDELTHVFLGHEAMHILSTDENYQEWINILLYSDVIPMFYELIEANSNEYLGNKIISWRLSKLLEYAKNITDEEINEYLKKDKDAKYIFLPEKQYLISYYYTVLLYQMYLNDSTNTLNQVKRVLNQEITTKQMLEEFNMLKRIEITNFEKSYRLVSQFKN